MFQEFGTFEPSSRCRQYEWGWVTSTTSKGTSQAGESFCQSLVVWIFHRMKSQTSKQGELMMRARYCLIACWCFANWVTTASHNSSSLVRTSTQELFDYSWQNCWTRKDLCSTSVGNIALEPHTSENGVWPMAQLRVMHRAHRTDGNSFIHFLAQGFSLSKMLGFKPWRIILLDHSAWPLLYGCETEA
jgi:hypothetical protein